MLLGMSKQLVYAFPGFYNKETICSNNLKTNSDSTRSCCLVWLWTWGKKKGKENSFGLVNKRFGLLPVWGKSPSYPGSCTTRVRILIAGIERVQ